MNEAWALAVCTGALVLASCGQPPVQHVRIEEPTISDLRGQWVVRDAPREEGPARLWTLDLAEDQSCSIASRLRALIMACNSLSEAPTTQLTCAWAIEPSPEGQEVRAVATADGETFLALRMALVIEAPAGDPLLYGRCRDGTEYTLVRCTPPERAAEQGDEPDGP